MRYRVINTIRSELKLNSQYKIKFLLILWRLAQCRKQSKTHSVLFLPVHILYWFYSQFLLGIEMPLEVNCVGPLIIWHGNGLVLNPAVELGARVVLRNGVTIGNDGNHKGCPVISDGVEIGANSVLIGDIKIGENAKIGPNSFVNYDVAEGEKIISATVKKK